MGPDISGVGALGGVWIPFLAALGRHLGYDLPTIAFPSQISLDSFLALVNVTPWVIGVALAVVAASYLVEKFKSPPDEALATGGHGQVGRRSGTGSRLLAQWQSAQVLYVEHGPLGRVTNASTCPPETRTENRSPADPETSHERPNRNAPQRAVPCRHP